jgi:SNF2 family DNA or RNA helicase
MSEGPKEIKLVTRTKRGLIKVPAKIQVVNGRIEFLKSPFALKDEIKSMQGAKWHGFEDKPRKIWSVKDCARNHFQLQCMMGQNPYEWFDNELQHWEYARPLRLHQKELSDFGLTYHYQIWAAEMGVGKTLSAIEVMEQSNKKNWWWIGPKKSLDASIAREFKKWNLDSSINIELMSYEMLTKRMKTWDNGTAPPEGVVFDESSRLKSSHSQRKQAAQALADGIRAEYGYGGYVILMSGTPSPKSPVDWWSQAEVAWPGFLREGSPQAFEQRLAHMVLQDFATGSFMKRVGWKDDENKCEICGDYADAPQHIKELCDLSYHDFVKGTNEVAYLEERLQGLVVVKHKKDCLDLPEKQYRIVNCEPNQTTLRVAKSLFDMAPSVITGLTLLRELSDGFQYREKVDGTKKCPVCEDGTTGVWVDPEDEDKVFQMIEMLDDDYIETLEKRIVTCPTCQGKEEIPRKVRVTREVPTPKEGALIDLLDENEEQGRIVIFAGFTGSLDRIIKICQKEGWHTVRCDGAGWRVEDDKGTKLGSKVDPLDYWSDLENNKRVAFVAHPQSGGLSITLTEARMSVFWSNDFNPESRSQAEDRIHRIGMDANKGATIVDLIHLPTDLNIRTVLKDNRRLELLTLGEVQNSLGV